MFITKYRVCRDGCFSDCWAVQVWRWYWPFWSEVGEGLLTTKKEAQDLIDTMMIEYKQ